MSYTQRIFFIAILITGFFCYSSVIAEITVDPIGIIVSLENEDQETVEMTLSNDGEDDVAFEIGFTAPPEEEERGGPRRDQPEGRGILIAERCQWSNWDFEQYFDAIDGLDYERYRTWNQVEDVDFNDFDFMWVGNYETEAWVGQYNQNLERIEDFVDGGGALYRPSGTNLHNTRPINPGGLVYNGNQSQNQCPLQLDPEENFLINYMNENDPFNWEWGEGQRLVGSGCAHGVFLQNDIDDLENVDWVQIMAMGNPTDEPIILTYQYGRGFVLASTTVDGFLHNNPANYHWGRTGEAVIWYLDFLSAPKWIEAVPDEGIIEGDDSQIVDINFTPEGLDDGVYELYIEIELSEPVEERDDFEASLIQISAIMSIGIPTVSISGTVTDARFGNPIEGAMLDVADHFFVRFTDREGEYIFENVPASIVITVTAEDFLPHVAEVDVEDEDVELNIELLHSTCLPSEESFNWMLEPDMEHTFNFVVDNDGNGPLTYRVDR
ncbi:carboxypeptidase regulatory-like domain-containing protein, partial [bacterium]|nr:carboxypeptidase regulatory-like domain-containing protein [bacterium]